MSELDATSLVIGHAPQYFFDDGIIESVENIKRTVHKPVKFEGNPLITRDRPWEHFVYFGSADHAIWRDDSSGQFRCLYGNWKFDRAKHAAEGGNIMAWEFSQYSRLYAHSDDGIRWEKPPVGLNTVEGQVTNRVLGDCEYGSVWNMTVLDDPFESDPDRRYKSLYSFIPANSPPTAPHLQEMRAAYSPDGIYWTPFAKLPIFGSVGNSLSDVANLSFDPVSRTYLLNTRHPWQGRPPRTAPLDVRLGSGGPGFDGQIGPSIKRGRRRIFQCESRDFLHWGELRCVLAPDPAVDNIDDSFYGMPQVRLGGQWVGFLDVFHMVDNFNDVQLAHSRDGRSWNRVAPGRAWLTSGPPGAWDQVQTYHIQALDVGDETWLYYGGSICHHDWWYVGQFEDLDVPEAWDDDLVRYGLGLAKLRREGYVSLDANEVREGVIVTQPFVSPGDRLAINARCGPKGYLKAEVTDVTGKAFAGRTWADCDVFTADAVRHEITWHRDAVLPSEINPDAGDRRPALQYRKLRFLLRDAEIYSFEVSSGPDR